MKSLAKVLIPIAIVAALFACSKDDDNPSGPNNNTTFRIVATVNAIDSTQSGVSGSVTFTVTNDSTVTGVFHIVEPAAADHNLTGVYVSTVNVLTASGSGYYFSGILNDTTGMLQGTITGGATGLIVGALDEGNDNSSIAYCGTFAGTDSGTWDFIIEGTSVFGSHSSSSGSEMMVGTVSGNIITLYQDGVQVATGVREGDNVSGTWNDTQHGNGGTWTGSRCN